MIDRLSRIGAVLFTLLFLSEPAMSQGRTVPIEPGVSLLLARKREKILREVGYSLYFNIPAVDTEPIDASVTISFKLRKTGEPLQLDFKETADRLESVIVNGKQIPVHFEQEHIIIAQEHLLEGNNAIAIRFRAGELSLNRSKDYLYTLLVPDRARTLFPCFDQPGIKARFKLSLSLPNHWSALSNAPVQDSLRSGENKIINYKESDLFSTYLFSFLAGRFEKKSQVIDGRLFTFYFRETDSSKLRLNTDTVFSAHATALKQLEEYTAIKFPFQKLDFAAIPDFQYGGMEHVGAINYRAASLFLDSGATKDQQNARSNLIAHEVSHMWFGNLVTMKWFDDVWMKEVFANFIADKITQGTETDTAYELKFLLTHIPDAYAIDRTGGAHPIRQDLSNLQEAGSLYGPIIYDKAPVMMRQLEKLMGKDAFQIGVREYLDKFRFMNADWSDLISILAKHTKADLKSWNKAWVQGTGRPNFDVHLKEKNGRIKKLLVYKEGEHRSSSILPQVFEMAFLYDDRLEEHTVEMKDRKLKLRSVSGKELPAHILFNSSGHGYGLFPIYTRQTPDELVTRTIQIQNPVSRASTYINWYESMLSQSFWKPLDLLNTIVKLVSEETEELNLSLLAGQLVDIYWQLIPPSERKNLAPSLESSLSKALATQAAKRNKKILFKTFQNIAISKEGLSRLYEIWKNQQPPSEVVLSEDDYTSLALNLIIKEHTDTSIFEQQLARVKNTDRRARLQFLEAALSAELATRDAFFNSMSDEKMRERETWVAAALSYLHHPLRAAYSIKYLPKSLDMLQEIQATGDIFFPDAWLTSSISAYQTSEAADLVRDFLKANPKYNQKLKQKILQAADPLFRAEQILNSSNK